MVVSTDNRDLSIERARLGLSQQDMADLLCDEPIGSGRGFNFSNVSRFETGYKGCNSMPPVRRGERRLGRSDYERVINQVRRERGQS